MSSKGASPPIPMTSLPTTTPWLASAAAPVRLVVDGLRPAARIACAPVSLPTTNNIDGLRGVQLRLPQLRRKRDRRRQVVDVHVNTVRLRLSRVSRSRHRSRRRRNALLRVAAGVGTAQLVAVVHCSGLICRGTIPRRRAEDRRSRRRRRRQVPAPCQLAEPDQIQRRLGRRDARTVPRNHHPQCAGLDAAPYRRAYEQSLAVHSDGISGTSASTTTSAAARWIRPCFVARRSRPTASRVLAAEIATAPRRRGPAGFGGPGRRGHCCRKGRCSPAPPAGRPPSPRPPGLEAAPP